MPGTQAGQEPQARPACATIRSPRYRPGTGEPSSSMVPEASWPGVMDGRPVWKTPFRRLRPQELTAFLESGFVSLLGTLDRPVGLAEAVAGQAGASAGALQ
ncbi:hypothetical protein ACFWBX_14470 [Streptomyces sp. NPDC059991]|uniref:hypothetical protein n=1 Tax=Streptomyces sp. NPDC059991 TaxID=3347028 RepID=UPI0036AC3916